MTTLRGDRIGILGAGAVGTALAVGLSDAGYNVTAIMSRNGARARSLASRVGGAIHTQQGGLLVDLADIAFVTVPDDAIASVAESVPWRAQTAAVHCSGGTPVSALDAATRLGAAIGGFHPLQTFPHGAKSPPSLDGVTFAIETRDIPLHNRLREMAAALGGRTIDIDEQSRALYHVSGVLASNFLTAIVGEAANLWSQFGYNHSQAMQALLPLIRGTVGNIEREGAAAALTGPIVRGDLGTVQAHLEQLRSTLPGVVPLYAALAQSAARLAIDAKRLDETRGAEILALLGGPSLTTG